MAEQIRESGRWLSRWGNQEEVNQGDVGGRLFTLAPIRDSCTLTLTKRAHQTWRKTQSVRLMLSEGVTGLCCLDST